VDKRKRGHRVRYRENPPPELRGLLSTAQAAALMGVSPRTFYTLVWEGEIPCYAEFGRAHLFHRADVLRARKRLYGY
jgi:excisionase family DNA binding protein